MEIKAQSKVGSTDYITHKPGGGTKKVSGIHVYIDNSGIYIDITLNMIYGMLR